MQSGQLLQAAPPAAGEDTGELQLHHKSETESRFRRGRLDGRGEYYHVSAVIFPATVSASWSLRTDPLFILRGVRSARFPFGLAWTQASARAFFLHALVSFGLAFHTCSSVVHHVLSTL